MAKPTLRSRIPQDLYVKLVNRRIKVKEAAAILNVTPNWLSHAIPERAPKKQPNSDLLRATRRLYRNQILKETVEGKHTVANGADLAHVSERTFYRMLRKYKNELQ